MGKQMTDGLPRLWQRVHKKTGYHRDDIRNTTFAVIAEMRLMMEEGVREIKFDNFVRFQVVIRPPRKCYDMYRKMKIVSPARYVPKVVFNKEMTAAIKSIPIKQKNA